MAFSADRVLVAGLACHGEPTWILRFLRNSEMDAQNRIAFVPDSGTRGMSHTVERCVWPAEAVLQSSVWRTYACTGEDLG